MDGRAALKSRCIICGTPCKVKYCVPCRNNVMRKQKEEHNRHRIRNYRVPNKSHRHNIALAENVVDMIVEAKLRKQAPCVPVNLKRTPAQWSKVITRARMNATPMSFTTQ